MYLDIGCTCCRVHSTLLINIEDLKKESGCSFPMFIRPLRKLALFEKKLMVEKFDDIDAKKSNFKRVHRLTYEAKS